MYSKPIQKEDIIPTLKQFIAEFIKVFPEARDCLTGLKTLGSAGRRDSLDSIELALDEKCLRHVEDWGLDSQNTRELFKKAKKSVKVVDENRILKKVILDSIADRIRETGSEIQIVDSSKKDSTIAIDFPQYDVEGSKTKKCVRINLNVGEPSWLSFTHASVPYKSNVKDLHRFLLLSSLFGEKGYNLSDVRGIFKADTEESGGNSPEQAVGLLNKLYGFNITQDILLNYFELQDFLRENLDEEELHRVWDRYLKLLDKTECDIPVDLQNYYLDNQDRLNLTGKFLPSSSKLYPFKD